MPSTIAENDARWYSVSFIILINDLVIRIYFLQIKKNEATLKSVSPSP